MIGDCMIWRRDSGSGLDAIEQGAKHYKTKYGRWPNFINLPPNFLDEQTIAKLRERWTVAQNAPASFPDEVWLGIKE